MYQLSLCTTHREELVNIRHLINNLMAKHEWKKGALLLFCPHTTGALTVNEAADPDVARDMVKAMRRLVQRDHPDYRHAEGNSDSHIKTSLFGPSLMLIVEDGEVQLGTWQGVYFAEWDGPRSRNIWVQWLPSQMVA